MGLYINEHDSSLIISTTFDSDALELVVEFKNNSEYKYFNFTLEEYKNFINASSTGKYFLENIRDNYEFEKL